MYRYSVVLQFSHDFKVDIKGLIKWAEDNLSLKLEQYNDSWISFYKESELTEDVTGEYKSDEHKQLNEHYNSLIEETEAINLALPSRLTGEELRSWEQSKKAEIAAVTDFSLLSEVQKKLWMGLSLSDDEKDSLGI